MKSAYDVIVVGAGPAGSVAARRAAEAGLSTLLLEKRRQVGFPVRCAEAVGADSTRQFIEEDERWIDARITHFAVCNPAGASVLVPPTEPTWVVDRKVFDVELARLAERAGAELVAPCAATGLVIEDGFVRGVKVAFGGRQSSLRSRLVVAADGTESQVTRWAGWRTTPALMDYYIGAEYLLDGLSGRVVAQVCQYHLDQRLAPGGYLWVFPKSADKANVGLVLSGEHARGRRAFSLLDEFISGKFPGSRRIARIAGGIPVSGALEQLVGDGLLAVGDAAHQADPLHGGGIDMGMTGADLAMRAAVKALKAGEARAQALRAYERAWRGRFGRTHAALYRVRRLLNGMDQGRIDRLIDQASQIPVEKLSLARIALTVARSDPRLFWQVIQLIAGGLITG